MRIVATRALTTVQIVRQPVMTVEQKENIHLRQSHNQREALTSVRINRKTMGKNYPPFNERLHTATIKGRLIDVYI